MRVTLNPQNGNCRHTYLLFVIVPMIYTADAAGRLHMIHDFRAAHVKSIKPAYIHVDSTILIHRVQQETE